MSDRHERAAAIVGLGAILPDAMGAPAFWNNVANKVYSITETPPNRWSLEQYYDPDPAAPDKTYSKIGGWVRGFEFDWRKFLIPPRVKDSMDEGQQWAVTIVDEALRDYGYPSRPLDLERTGIVFGAAMGGEMQNKTVLTISFPEYVNVLSGVEEFAALPGNLRTRIIERWREAWRRANPPVTEDSMPGELANILSGRVANVLNMRGPNFTTDAACASSFAALEVAVHLLVERHADAVFAGGVDRNMGATTFVKFCKIGALSGTGTRPFGDGADGFVMGEGSAAFLLKRLADAERDGDKIYAVVRGVAGSSDGKGKGITAPNPVGQKLAVLRAWDDAGLDPATATLLEAHGTSTKVGDVAEVESLAECFRGAGRGAIALGSAKSNVGHLKAGAGAAGLLKAIYALHHKLLPPTLNAERPNPGIAFAETPFRVNHELREWTTTNGAPRRVGVSAYGFGGTNFHAVLEEHIPGTLTSRKPMVSVPEVGLSQRPSGSTKAPLRGMAALGAPNPGALLEKLSALLARVEQGYVPEIAAPAATELSAEERLVVDFGNHDELASRLQRARKALAADTDAAWRPLHSQGVFRGRGPRPGKMAFLFPGQGSQYVNMGRALAAREPIVARTFEEADRAMEPVLGQPLTRYIFVDAQDPEAVKQAEQDLMQTAITQPAVLTVDTALCRLLGEYGIEPDMVTGHSLGEYGALVAAGVLPFADALYAAAARGREMTRVSLDDNGCMAAVMAPLEAVEEILKGVPGYVVPANINSHGQCVIGGATDAVNRAIEAFGQKGYSAQIIPVSHAFHTEIVAPASQAMRSVLDRLSVASPRIPVISNVTGDFYPRGVEEIKDLLVLQIASTVQWVKGTERLYSAGAQAFVEVGPKRTLKGFIDNILAHRHDAVSVSTNHPRGEGIPAFNQALCALYAAGYGAPAADREAVSVETVPAAQAATPAAATVASSTALATAAVDAAAVSQLNRLLAEAIQRLSGPSRGAYDRNEVPLGSIVISGTGLGLPGTGKAVMDPSNVDRILRGEQFIDLIPERLRREMAAKEVTRVVKSADGSGHFETIRDTADVIKLAARAGRFDLTAEYGVPAKLVEALDSCTQLAMAAGLDALREAGIPLVQTYRKTTTGKHLPDRWMLPESMRDETGVVFASAWPGLNSFSEDVERYHTYATRKARRDALEDLRRYASDAATLAEIQRRIVDLDDQLAREPYAFDRRFLLRVLCMGHSQFAEYVGARGPNTHVNSACASTAMGIALAEDWIRSGRCRRVVVLGGDNATSDTLFPWLGAGFLASGAAATDDKVEEAALPFDRRRHGMIIGMGACALVVESQDAVEERGMRGLVEVLATDGRSSAFHPTRLDVDHISQVLDSLITASERRFGLNRNVMAPETVFVSHETYTPARGGSASAEVMALRKTFGQRASEIVIANTKGFTGHPMGVGVEDVIAVKILEHGIVPPVPNFKEVDPELGVLTLSRGGRYPVKYAIHLAAGFGSQIAFTLLRRIPGGLDRIDHKATYDRWLADVSGYDRPATEVMSRVLRIASQGAPSRLPAPSSWTLGLGPVRRAAAPGDGGGVAPLAVPAAVAPPPAVLASAPAQPAAPPGTKPLEAPPPPPPAAPSVAPAVATQKPAGDAVTERVLAIVAEKTGYPPEMLDPDLDLEADLGVDTVKQAETFAGVREAYAISRDENLKLRDFPTIRHVVKFVLDRRPDLAATAPAPAAPAAPPASLAPSPSLAPSTPAAPAAAPAAATPARPAMEAAPAPLDDVSAKVLAIIADKTGYPPDMLDMDLDLEADLGVDTVKQAETFAGVREAYDIPRDENLKLRDFPTIRHVVKFVLDRRPDLAAAPAAAAPAAPHLSLAPSAPVPTAAAPAPTVPVAAAMGAAPASLDDVSAKVLAIIADKTGYPPDMLDMDLDLEADLGVDTVKQAETFAGVREAYDISRDENLKLRDFPTIRHVVKFVLDRRPDLVAAPAIAAAVSAPVTAPRTTAPATSKPAVARLEDADRFPRRVPVPSLRPPIDLMKSTGVTLGKSSRVVVALDEGGVGTALRKKLESEGVSVLSVDKLLAAADLESAIRGWLAGGPIHGVFWLPALDVERALSEMDLAGFREANRVRVKNLAAAMRVLYDVIAGQGSFLVAATRMGGFHGQGGIPATAPLGGAVSGFAKAYKRERTSALVKVVDFPVGAKAGHVAESLVAEAQADPGVVEVGYRDGFRWTISLEERSAVDGRPGLSLGKDTVFIVTGAAGGITSAIVADLAGASGGTFYLLDRAPEPKRDDPRIQMLRADREGLKRALIEEAKARGERPLPPQIDKQILGIEREASALQAIEGVEAAGGTAHYRCVNLLDGAAVGSVVEEIRKGHGRVDALVHAGGIEISRALADKAQQEYDLVFDIKADGFFSLLKAAEGLPIGATVVFSSVAGRFGNSGQTDYSAANALLCSLSSHLEGLRPETRPIAIDWTAWGGIGMATRGSIPKIMEAAGIETLPPEVGIPTVRRELVAGGSKGELVVGGRLGIMGAEWDETGGLDAGKAAAHLASLKRPLLMVSAVKGAPLYGGLTVETTLDPNVQPFLFDHQMEGLPLLPGVMGTETFAEAAAILCPGAAVLAVEDEEFLRPFKYYRMQPATFHVSAVGRPAGDGEVVVDAQLKALIQPKPDVPAQEKLHFRARVRLGRKAAERPSTSFKKPASKSLTIGRDAIYKVYFHGPAYRVLDRVKVEGDAAVGLMAGDLPVDTVPAKAELLMAPRLLELCFQTAGIWEVKTNHVLALPAGLESVTAHRRLQDAEGRHLYAVVTARSGRYDAKVVDDKGDVYLELVGYRTVPLEGRQTIEE